MNIIIVVEIEQTQNKSIDAFLGDVIDAFVAAHRITQHKHFLEQAVFVFAMGVQGDVRYSHMCGLLRLIRFWRPLAPFLATAAVVAVSFCWGHLQFVEKTVPCSFLPPCDLCAPPVLASH